MESVRRSLRRFRRTRTFAVAAAVLVLALLCGAEFWFSNRLRWSVPEREEFSLSLIDAVTEGTAERTEAGILLREGASVRFEGLNVETADVAVTAESADLRQLTLSVTAADDGSKNQLRLRRDGYLYTDEPAFFRLTLNGSLRTLQIDCTAGREATLTAVTLNLRPPVRFSFVRVSLAYAFLLFAWAVYHFRWWKVRFSPCDKLHRAIALLPLALCLASLFPLCAGAGLKEVSCEQPLPNAYEQLFDSFLDGRLDLDVPFDPAELEKLDNPYDYTERLPIAENGYGPFWDRAYYGGKFYCYFGVAPVLTVFFPVYLLTGRVPNEALTVLLLLLVGTVALFGVMREVLRYFRIRPPLLLVCLGFPALFCGLLFPMIACSADMYYIATASALTFLCLTLWLGFAAVNRRGKAVRRICFAISGVCLALTAASRPTVAVYAALLLPSFFAVLASRDRSRGEKWADALSFVLPLLCGVIPLLWYNAVRFGSPLEFGASYQLTYGDVRGNRLRLELLGETVFHYFLQPPAFTGLFPYLRPSLVDLHSYGAYCYLSESLGALCFPLSWCGFAQGRLTKGKPVKRAMYLLAVALPFCVAFCELCLGGVNLRYLADVMPPLLLVGALVLLERAGENPGFGRFCAAWAVFAATFFVSFALIFANERNWVSQYAPSLFRAVSCVFS